MLKDILAALEKWPLWKRVSETPERVESLEKRVAELELKLGGKWPADVCPFCGERAMRMAMSFANMTVWNCTACKGVDKRPR